MYAQAFLYSDQQEMVLGPTAFQGPRLTLVPSLHAEQALLRQAGSSASGQSKLMQQLAQHTAERYTLLLKLLALKLCAVYHAGPFPCIVVKATGCSFCRDLGATSQPVSWRPLGAGNLTLTKQYPLNGGNRVAMHLRVSQGGGGILNGGFWGIPVRRGGRYELSVFLRQPDSADVRKPLHLWKHILLLRVRQLSYLHFTSGQNFSNSAVYWGI